MSNRLRFRMPYITDYTFACMMPFVLFIAAVRRQISISVYIFCYCTVCTVLDGGTSETL